MSRIQNYITPSDERRLCFAEFSDRQGKPVSFTGGPTQAEKRQLTVPGRRFRPENDKSVLHVFMLRHVNFSNNRYGLFTLNAHLLLNEATIYDFNKK